MIIRVPSLGFVLGIMALWAELAVSQPRQPSVELVVVVNPGSRIESMSPNELARALRGRDSRIKMIGIQRPFYTQVLKAFLKTSPGNFERKWLMLITTGKARVVPLVTDSTARLIGLVRKNKRAMVILDWNQIGKKPSDIGVKVARIGNK